jgi:hypothetical protein
MIRLILSCVVCLGVGFMAGIYPGLRAVADGEQYGMVAMGSAYEQLGATNVNRHQAYNLALTNLVILTRPK